MENQVMEWLSVLHVEDDENVRESLLRLLQRRFGHVFSAGDGKEGLEIFRSNHPDIVITDIQMPEMDGLEMSSLIREERPDLPIIITTAYNEMAFLERAASLGIQRYIRKPIVKNEFLGSLYEVALVIAPDGRIPHPNIRIILDGINEAVIFGVKNRIIQANQLAKDLFGEENLPEDCDPSSIILSLPQGLDNWQKTAYYLKENISGDVMRTPVSLKIASKNDVNKYYTRVEWNKENEKFIIAFAHETEIKDRFLGAD